MLKNSLQTITWGDPKHDRFDHIFALAAETGFDGLEIGFRRLGQVSIDTARTLLDRPGMVLNACHVGCNLVDLTQSVNERAAADVAVTVDNTTPATLPDGTIQQLRSFVTGGTRMTFYVQGGAVNWTMIHEVDHTFGLPDEYTYNRPSATPAPTCTYTGADDPNKRITLSASTVPPDAAGQHSFDNASVMGQANNTTYPDNLFYWVAIEVKRILSDNGVTADVKVVSS